jgi:non-heme chloroperoxidase
MYFIEVEKGVKLYVEDLNQAGERTIVFIHGWPVDHRMYEYQFNMLLQNNFRCIGIDLRGFGNSDCPAEGYSYDRMAEDIFIIINKLKLQNIILVGFSMGGAIAIRYMTRYRGYQVIKLALLSAAAPSFTQRPGYPYGMTRVEVDKLIKQAYKNRPEMLSDFSNIFFASIVTPSFKSWFFSLGLAGAGLSTIKTAEALRDEDLRGDLDEIRVTTGIFHGEKDQVCPFEFAREMNKGIRGSKLYNFKFSGHAVFYDELDKFNATFLQFLII